MDNYQRLFTESRPQRSDKITLPNSDDLKKNIESEWIKCLYQAVRLSEQKDFLNAVRLIDKAIQENGENPNLYKVRANIKEKSGDSLGAILDYKKSLYISGSDWYAIYNQIAINFMNRKEFKSALTAFNIAIELKIKLKEERIEENVMPYLLNGVVTRIDFERMYTNRANVKMSLQDFQGCADDCELAIDANPEYSNSYFIYGLLFLTVEQNENAYKALRMAENKGHNQATIVLNQFF